MEISIDTIAEMVIQALKRAGYAESTIGQYRKSIKALRVLAEEQDGLYTKELGSRFTGIAANHKTGSISKHSKARKRRLIRIIDSYVDTGIVDLSAYIPCKGKGELESVEFKQLLAAWCADMEKKGLAKSTIASRGYVANEYLLDLERCGISTASQADSSTVLSFLCLLKDGTWAKASMCTLVTNLRAFLCFLGREDLISATDMIGARKQRGIVPRIDNADIQKVIDACLNGHVPARDAAITLLALLTGIRACDIIALKVEDIDWQGSVNIIQQKTKNHLALPLLTPIGNAMSRYLLEERPSVGDNHLFLRSRAPYCALTSHGIIYQIISKTFGAAGATMKKCGTRLLRHNAVTRMVDAGTPLPTVSAILGHADPDSADVYISTDEKRMRLCVLPLPEGVLL